MVITLIGIASIACGFACVLAAYYSFQRGRDRRVPAALAVAAFVFLTVIPVIGAVFFAARG
nr:hypothetical protein [Corynebacterium massiliense]